jgi:hypothetical protein
MIRCFYHKTETVIFSLIYSFCPHYGPGIDSASNRNEYQKYFPGVKVAGAYDGQTYYLRVPIVLKSGSLNLLESSGPVQACNGIALTLLIRPSELSCFCTLTVPDNGHGIHRVFLVCLFVCFIGATAASGLWPPHLGGFYITHKDAPQSVGLPCMSDQLVAQTST